MRRMPKINDKKAEVIDSLLVEPAITRPHAEPASGDISLDDLLSKQIVILYRETRNLLAESSKGLLSPQASASFERVMKLTADLKKKEKELLDGLSDEELDKLAGQ